VSRRLVTPLVMGCPRSAPVPTPPGLASWSHARPAGVRPGLGSPRTDPSRLPRLAPAGHPPPTRRQGALRLLRAGRLGQAASAGRVPGSLARIEGPSHLAALVEPDEVGEAGELRGDRGRINGGFHRR
jgi:hypothetical protein